MKRIVILFFVCFATTSLSAQVDTIGSVIDVKYREDQFYLGISFNIINEKPVGLTQTGFSGGLYAGFMRDFPLNERRNVSIAGGLGWAFNTYNQNLFIGKADDVTIYTILDGSNDDYETNRFNTFLIEVPIEFRWRTSTPTIYNFWRIYPGFKFGYIYYFRSKYVQESNIVKQTNPKGLDRLRLGATLSMGKANFNINFYYGINSMFENRSTETDVNFSVLKVGLIFYIL